MASAERDLKRKKAALQHARETKSVSMTCRFFGICRQTFYDWKNAYEEHGDQGLVNRRPGPIPAGG